MATCINKSLPEFKALQLVTQIHPAVLAAKIAVWQNYTGSDEFPKANDLYIDVILKPEEQSTIDQTYVDPFSQVSQERRKSDIFIENFIQKLQNNLGIKNDQIEHVTREEARVITQDAINPIYNQPAFYYNGKVYFVKGQINYSTVMHEFSHPLVRTISLENNKLFNKIFDDIITDPKGQEFLAEAIEEYKELDPNHNQIKEEVIVKAMTYVGENKDSKDFEVMPSKGLLAAIEKFIYAIKQMFRKISSEVNPKDLNPNTTVKQLADMLINKTWNINMDIIPKEDIVAYMENKDQAIKELDQVLNSGTGIAAGFKIYDDNVNTYRSQLRDMKENGQYSDILDVLAYDDIQTITEKGSEDLRGFGFETRVLVQAKRDQKYKGAKTEEERAEIALKNEEADLKDFKTRNRILYENLVLREHEVDKITNHLRLLAAEPDQQKAFAQIQIYIRHLKSIESTLDSFDNELQIEGLDNQAQIRKDIGTILRGIKDANDSIKSILETSISESLADRFNAGMSKGVQKKNDQIQRYKNQIEKGGDAAYINKLIEKLEKERDAILKTPEVMLDYLMGRNGDISYMSSQLENFISSQDPTISTFAKYVKDNHSIVRAEANKGKNDLLYEIDSLIKKIGITPDNLVDFSKQLLFNDISTRKNKETGELEEYVIPTLLNPFQNFKHDLAVLNDKRNKARDKWQENPSTENFDALSEIVALRANHLKLYFKRAYVDKYYRADDALLAATAIQQNEDGTTTVINIGQQAREEANEKYEELVQFQNAQADADINEAIDFDTVERLLGDYRKLFSLYDDYGKRKVDNPKAGQFPLTKAKLLIENRTRKRKFYDYKLIKNAFEKSLRGAEAKIKAELEDAGIKVEDPEYATKLEEKLQLWIDQNTHSKNKDSFYALRAGIYEEIQEILSTGGSVDKFAAQRLQLLETLQGRKDEDGQPLANEMTEELLANIKKIQLEIIAGQEESKNANLTEAQKGRLNGLFKSLQDIQKTEATSYYIDTIDNFYRRIKKAEGETNPKEVTLENVDKFLSVNFINGLKGKDEEFDKWFQDNHIIKEKYYPEGTIQEYERIKVWSVVKPTQAKHIETTEIFDEEGLLSRTIQGVPKMKYYKRYVKDEFTTGYDKTTKEVDPNAQFTIQGFQMPKSLEEMKEVNRDELSAHNEKIKEVLGKDIPFDHYLNNKYAELKAENGPQFELLETLRRFHYKSQSGLDKNKTLGDELPRERRDNYQYLKSGDAAVHLKEKFNMIQKGVLQIIGKKADDYERGVNYEEEARSLGAEAYAAEEGTKIPIRGKYNLDTDQISEDVLGSLFTYYLSAEQNKMLRKLQPTAEAIRDMAKENNPTMFKEIKQGMVNNMEQSAVRVPVGKSTDNRRAHLLEGMVEVLFEGKSLKESNNNPTGVKITNVALGIAAHSFFALDLTSALKNFYGAQFQIALEAAGNKYFGYKSWQRGRPWAFKTMAKISQEVYNQQAKSLEIQLVDVFDAAQGRFQDKFGESPSRSLARDTANLSWLTSHRKWLETEATLQIFSAIMYDTKVTQTLDGISNEISYIDAWELDKKGSIKLKDGIDKTWDLGGEKFLDVTNANHETSNFLQGMYSQADKPLINRAIAWRMFGSLKNYFTKMFLHRYAAAGLSLKNPSSFLNPQERVNLATGQMHMGFYWQNILLTKELIKTGGKHILYMNAEEKRAGMLGLLEFLKVQLFGMAAYLIMASFGTDPDDEKRWSKMKKQTGALPTILTNEEYAEQFNLSGWSRAHLLLLMMSVETEANAFILAPDMGINHMYNTVAGQSSIAMGASFEAIKDMIADLYFTVTGDDRVVYKKDASGLKAKSEGTNKFIYKLMRMSGISGKFIDPLTTARNIESARKSNKS